MEPIRHAFTSMGTKVQLIAAPESDGRDVARALRRVWRIFAREDVRFSRFRPDSELSTVNARAGEWVPVSAPFATLIRMALKAARDTDGLFDPTVLPALMAAGYDRDFADVVARGDREDEELRAIRRGFADLMIKSATACGAWRDVELDGSRLRIPVGAALDLGGIAKGWTVDLAVASLTRLPWAIVDAGGDLRIAGRPSEGVDVGIEDPDVKEAEVLRLRLDAGALATTSVTVRAWAHDAHHLIDPRTSLPARTGVVQATMWAPTCAEAEVSSKEALLRGPEILDRVRGCLVMATGEVITNLAEAAMPA